MLQLQQEDTYCSKLIRAIEQCVDTYNNYYMDNPIVIADKTLNAHTVMAKKISNEYRIAVLDSMSDEDKLRELVWVFSRSAGLTHIFARHGNIHVWDAVLRYVLFGECTTEEFQIKCQEL